MHVETEIAIVGSGFAGICMAIRLQEAGIYDFVILEKSDEVGGTWRDNVYPGAACDVQSHLYSFSFAPNPDWSRKFAPQEEILAYLKRCADRYALRPKIRFHSAVAEARWNDAQGRWHAQLEGGDTVTARALVLGCGAFNKPVIPDIDGLSDFAGAIFHTARWPHDAKLDAKRVAVIGTGASAIQVVPAIAPKVASLTLFQRTPPWVMPKPNPAYTAAQKEKFRRVPLAQKLERARIYAANELFAVGFLSEPRIMQLGEKRALDFLAREVPDPALRAKLTPTYRMGCKRVLLSDDYLATFRRDNVQLVTSPIARVRADGIETRDGATHALDAIVMATGFQVAESVAPFRIYGREGIELNDAWQAGAEAYKGTSVAGYPNAFMIVGPNTGLGHSSMVLMIEAQANYTLEAIRLMRHQRLSSIEVQRAAQERYNARIQARMQRTVWSRGGCVSYYQTRSGKNTTLWPGYTFEFIAQLRTFDSSAYRLGRAASTRAARATRPAGAGGADDDEVAEVAE